MRKWLRRVRAAVGMGLSWAVVWAPVGVLIGWVFGGSSWGALGGLVVGVLAVAAWQLDAGFGPVLWQRAAVLVGSSTKPIKT